MNNNDIKHLETETEKQNFLNDVPYIKYNIYRNFFLNDKLTKIHNYYIRYKVINQTYINNNIINSTKFKDLNEKITSIIYFKQSKETEYSKLKYIATKSYIFKKMPLNWRLW